jgi:hypothetical protein
MAKGGSYIADNDVRVQSRLAKENNELGSTLASLMRLQKTVELLGEMMTRANGFQMPSRTTEMTRCLPLGHILAAAVSAILCAVSCAAQVPTLSGDGRTDDTNALNAAIAQACRVGGSVVLPPPPVVYKVTSTLKTPCRGLHIIGQDAKQMNQIDQFGFPPMVPIRMAGPTEEPVFTPPAYTTFENLDIEGYNQAVVLYNDVNVSFRNVCMSVNGVSGMPDNTPLKISNSFWIWYKGGCLMAKDSTTTPIILMTGEQVQDGQAPLNGLITIEDVTGAGGGMKYIQRVNQWGTAGNLTFRNILIEDITTDILSMTSENGARYGEFENITFDRVGTSDGAPVSLISANDPSLTIKGLFVNQSGGRGAQKIRGQVVGYFDTAGVFDSMSGNLLTVGKISFGNGNIQLGLSSSGALSVYVPLFQPPSNVQVTIGNQPGTLVGTHTYFIVAADGHYQSSHYSAFAFAAAPVTLVRSGSATVTWTPSPSNPPGYMVQRDDLQSFWVPGGSSSSFTDVGAYNCCFDRSNTPSLVPKPIVTQ